ncbi:hypothetical protein I7I48_01243 [Histoplasma ohiense]|nr:hypothetical protein I7I48_01243 [Histoplasma ohiense (nom. inval.)]
MKKKKPRESHLSWAFFVLDSLLPSLLLSCFLPFLNPFTQTMRTPAKRALGFSLSMTRAPRRKGQGH